MTKYPSWSWAPCEDPVWTPPEMTEGSKTLTVVTWNAGYRESRWLELSFECLARQQDRDAFEFIHLDWGSEPTQEALKHDFINVVCMDLPLDRAVHPSFDSGIQWSLALFLARTPYVTYFHNDIILPKQMVVIQDKILNHPECAYFEGYEVNRDGRRQPDHKQEFLHLLDELGADFVYLPERYEGDYRKPPQQMNANLCTVRVNTLLELQGWYWNFKPKSEYWIGPGLNQDIYKGLTLREKMLAMELALVMQEDMGVFTIPHGTHYAREDVIQQDFRGGIKHWAEFLSDWLPQHPYRIVSGPRAG